jgi:hypothetical protein
MKQKIVLLAIAILCGMNVLATNLVIERYAGAEMVQDIALIGKWVFVDTNLQLLDKQGNVLATEPLDNVRKIVFSNESITTALENVENGTIIVYPNPTQDVLHIQGIEAQTLRVFNMQGSMLQTTVDTQVSVSDLPVGTYLLQIGTQVIRFIKQ